MLYAPKTAVVARRQARVEIIPLIDVIFFLLATFVLFTLSANKIQVLDIPLPKAGGEELLEPFRIQVSGDSTVYWNGELIPVSDLTMRLTSYKGLTSDPRVLISTDERATMSDAVRVLDEVRIARVNFSVETRPRSSGR